MNDLQAALMLLCRECNKHESCCDSGVRCPLLVNGLCILESVTPDDYKFFLDKVGGSNG